jgi:glycosyltransferase involved in cell wall biosynthesis
VRLSDDRPSISVVIPVRNEGARVHRALASIISGRARPSPTQIVVVDDASSDDCCASLPECCSWSCDRIQLDVIRLPRWSGIPYARNVGAAAARGEVLVITDANVCFPAGWDALVAGAIAPNRVLCATIADENSSFRGFGCTLDIPSMSAVWLASPTTYGGYVPISPCTGTVLTTDLFRRAGGYDTGMPVYGAAEPEFSVRLWLLGAVVIGVPGLVLRHRFRPSAERQPFLGAIAFTQLCNYLRFGLLYLDPPRIRHMFQHYSRAQPDTFAAAVRTVYAGDVWRRRESLRRALPFTFDSFVKRFGLCDSRGDRVA